VGVIASVLASCAVDRGFEPRSWREKVNFQWDDDEVRFVIEQHAELYSASSLKQQSADKNVAPLGHIILIPSQQVSLYSIFYVPLY
jgi:hypothetical protein